MSKSPKADESGLVSAARKVGSAAGKLAAMVGASAEAAPAKAVARKGKLEKKKHHRLPRKAKKALKQLNAAGRI